MNTQPLVLPPLPTNEVPDLLYLDELLRYLHIFDNACIICFLKIKSIESHVARDCNIGNRCYVCLKSGHYGSKCPQTNFNPSGHCNQCWLPDAIGSVQFHPTKGFANCKQPKNVFKLFIMLSYESQVSPRTPFIDDLLSRMPNGALKVHLRFVEYMRMHLKLQ